jgi:hypothetical protein
MLMTRREFAVLTASAAAALLAGCKPKKLRLRKEVNALSAAELASFRAGVDAMQQLARDNVLSWEYQRAVHGIPPGDSGNPDPPGTANYWRKCHHHTDHFFDWHRWELFYFEQICRQLCGDSKFTLPYWDYFADAHLPVAFRPPSSGTNVLAHDRNPALNDGSGELNVSATGMNELALFDFQSDFEFNPHDTTHIQIGFDMGDVPTAALDPVFYVHHCNVDRYWDVWLRQGGGRANPGGAWASTTFDFQSVAGPKTPTAGGADTPEKMGYTYQPPRRPLPPHDLVVSIELLKKLRERFRYRIPKPVPPPPPEPGPGPAPWRALDTVEGFELDGVPTVVPVASTPGTLKTFADAGRQKSVQLALTFANLKATELARKGGYFYQIFLVPSARALSDGKVETAAEIRGINAFTLSVFEHAGHAAHGGPARYVVELNAAARDLLARSAGSDPALVFVRRGLIIDGKEDESNADQALFTFDSMSLAVRERGAQK